MKIGGEGLCQVYACLIGYGCEHPQQVGEFVGQRGLVARFGLLVTIKSGHHA